MDSRYSELARMIEAWPGLVSGPARGLIDDCLVLLHHLGDAHTLVDVGSGGGLPGLPLKIARPDLDVTLVEADESKAAFLVQTAARLGLDGVHVVALRAEDVGRDPRHRERYDVVVARAVAALPALAELCLPLVKVGGRMLAQKTDREDVGRAAHAIEILGGSPAVVAEARSVARTGGTVITVDKIKSTPAAYPRRAGVPLRKPL